MWKVGDVEPVRVMGAEGYPYGFNVTTEGRQTGRFICLCVARSRRGSRNTSGICSSERTLSASPRRLTPVWTRSAPVDELGSKPEQHGRAPVARLKTPGVIFIERGKGGGPGVRLKE